MNDIPDQMRRLVNHSRPGGKPSLQEAESDLPTSGDMITVRSTPEPVVGVKAAARFLGVSPSLVYAYVERRQVPHYRIGQAIRFKLSELEAWLKQFRVNGGIEICQ
jgi:excisionase family DNA binding protein